MMRNRQRIVSNNHSFHMNPMMADTAVQYVVTVMNNLESDYRMQDFLSQDELDVLTDAISILEDVAAEVRRQDEWN